MKKTKIFLIIVCIVFLVSLQALAGTKKSEDEPEAPAVEKSAPAEPEPEPVIKMGIATVSWKTDASWGTSMKEASEYIAQKYSNVDVTFVDALPCGDFGSWLQLQCESGTSLFFLDSNAPGSRRWKRLPQNIRMCGL